MDSEKGCVETNEELTADVVSVDPDMEEMAAKMIARAASLTGVKIDRATFLRTELKRHCPEIDAELAVETTPSEAGLSPADIDRIALAAIDFETMKCAALSFAAGVPGGVALAGTVPADVAQYFAHVMRIEQKLAYLYGWQSFLDENDEVDDETVAMLVSLMGIALGVGGVASSITKFATETAQKHIAKTIERQALTKTFFYTPMKKVLRVLGVNLTKQTFAKGVGKIVPVVGGVVSGGVTYASFKPGAERLRRYLRELPLSGIDVAAHPDRHVLQAEKREKVLADVTDHAKKIGMGAVQAAGDALASGAAAADSAATDIAQRAGRAFSGILVLRQSDSPHVR